MTTDTAAEKATTLAQWKKNRVHTVTLPSNTVIEIIVPDLPALVKAGAIPNELVDIAIQVAEGERKVTREDLVKQSEFYDRLVIQAVHAPKLAETDVPDIPFEDKEMIVQFATRQRDMDALGHQLAGLEKVKQWRTFRGLDPLYEGLEDK